MRLILLALLIATAAAADNNSGIGAKIFIALPDGTYREGTLTFGRYDLRVTGNVKDLGLVGGEYKSTGTGNFTFTCTAAPADGPAAKVVWSGTFTKGNDWNNTADAISGTVVVTPRGNGQSNTRFTFSNDRPRPRPGK
jgi:hypothetical protein